MAGVWEEEQRGTGARWSSRSKRVGRGEGDVGFAMH